MKTLRDSHIWIIGASSGIGAALAQELAQRGAILTLSARREDALRTLAAALPGQHRIEALDVGDLAAVLSAVQRVAQKGARIDSVINLSALYTPMALSALDMDQVADILRINLGGAFNVVHAVLPVLQAQQTGQIVLCGSVAGFSGLPNGQPYSATKAGVINLAESLRAEVAGTGVSVKLINPGFVRTPLTDKNTFSMPAMIEPAEAARRIADGLTRDSFEIHFPKRLTWALKCLRMLPYSLYFRVMRRVRAA